MVKDSKASKKRLAVETSESLKMHPTVKEVYALGKALRDKCPRQEHAWWQTSADRPTTVDLIKLSNQDRIEQLVPIRHGRMVQSPFAFFRGAALNMAADLARTPVSGLRVQACGDCHLLNFGSFATPERRVIFDINDLDETLPAPWEWDIKRLATSFVLACRDNGHSESTARDAVETCARSYRERMREYSEKQVLDIWYASIDAEQIILSIRDQEARKRMQKRLDKARSHSVLEHEFPELVATVGKSATIRESPPLIYHARENNAEEQNANLRAAFARYRETMQEDKRLLLDRFQLMDMAVKVVGVGSVGTFCGILLLMASEHDPLFLQFKQARPSVLEPYAGKSLHANHGQRIVHGCRMMQSASDLFLGWTEGNQGRHFYIRQLKDMKMKPMIELFTPALMVEYAQLCGWTLAHAHARSGEPAKISGYLGNSDKFDKALCQFAVSYANQSEQDHDSLVKAIRSGELEAFIEEV